jgi:hypothetical protein
MPSDDSPGDFVVIEKLSHLVRIASGHQYLVIFLSEFLDDRAEERDVRRIIQIYPDFFSGRRADELDESDIL